MPHEEEEEAIESAKTPNSLASADLRYTWVQAIFLGFFRCKKRDSFFELRNRKD